ncbi:MAG: thrombospondin type 3 repeat-containing protein [Gammaproteobacteria bacterium]
MKKTKALLQTGTLLTTLALSAGASAAIVTEGDIDDPAAEMFLTVHDSSRGITYTRDLGITLNAFQFSNFDFEFSPDDLYLNTFGDSAAGDLRYSVVGVENFSFGGFLTVFTTSNSPTIDFPTDPLTSLQAIHSAVSMFTAAHDMAAGTTDPAENLSSTIELPASNGFYTNPATFNESLGSVVLFSTGATVGETLAFYAREFDQFSGGEFSERDFERAWTLSADGMLRYGLTGDVDTDNDGVADVSDNCTLVANADQIDGDADGIGNLCDTDLNNDCVTNVVDLGLFRSVFFSADPAADFNSDGSVNVADLGILRTRFLQPPGPSGQPNGCSAAP